MVFSTVPTRVSNSFCRARNVARWSVSTARKSKRSSAKTSRMAPRESPQDAQQNLLQPLHIRRTVTAIAAGPCARDAAAPRPRNGAAPARSRRPASPASPRCTRLFPLASLVPFACLAFWPLPLLPLLPRSPLLHSQRLRFRFFARSLISPCQDQHKPSRSVRVKGFQKILVAANQRFLRNNRDFEAKKGPSSRKRAKR